MDYFDILLAKKLSGGGGGDIDVESLTATENRTYNAGTGKAYNPVVVAVPEPTLIAKSISQNGTYNASDDNADGYSSVTVDVEGYQIKNIANVPTDIASFTDGTDLPMPKLEVGIEAVQSGSGDPSPENVRPISGWTGAEVHNFGLPNGYKAVDYVTLTAPVVYDGITDFNRNDLCIITDFKVETVSSYGAIYSAYSGETNNATRLIQNGTSPNSLLVNNNAKANVPSTVAQSGGYISNGFNKFISYHSSYNINGNTSSSSVASGDNNTATSLNLCSSSNSVSFRRFDIQSQRTEGGETIYTPLCSLIPCTNPQGIGGFWDVIGGKFYTTSDPTKITATGTPNRGTEHIADVTYPITFGQTVYGGVLDVTSGVLTVTKGIVDLSTITTWNSGAVNAQTGMIRFLNTINGKEFGKADMLCNLFPTKATTGYDTDTSESISGITSSNALYLVINSNRLSGDLSTRESRAEALLNWLENNPTYVVYNLDEPTTVQLTPTQVKSLLKDNNIWADSGQIISGQYFAEL